MTTGRSVYINNSDLEWPWMSYST